MEDSSPHNMDIQSYCVRTPVCIAARGPGYNVHTLRFRHRLHGDLLYPVAMDLVGVRPRTFMGTVALGASVDFTGRYVSSLHPPPILVHSMYALTGQVPVRLLQSSRVEPTELTIRLQPKRRPQRYCLACLTYNLRD